MALDPTKVADLRRMYLDEGLALPSIGRKYGRSPGTVWEWMKKAGIPTRSIQEGSRRRARTVHPDEVREMVRLYGEGLSSNDVGDRLGRDGRLVRAHLEEAGVLRTRNEALSIGPVREGHVGGFLSRRAKAQAVFCTRYNEEFFDVLTEESAWVLGLIFGDGHVQWTKGKCYTMTLAGTEDVCRKVMKLLACGKEPRKHSTANCWLAVVSNKRICSVLKDRFGIVGNKACIMRFPDLPSDSLASFVRGLWDSDGCWRLRGRSLRASYTCSSEMFIDMLAEFLRSFGWAVNKYKHVVELNGKIFTGYRIDLKVEGTRGLARWMYEGSEDRIRCARKFGVVSRAVAFDLSPYA